MQIEPIFPRTSVKHNKSPSNTTKTPQEKLFCKYCPRSALATMQTCLQKKYNFKMRKHMCLIASTDDTNKKFTIIALCSYASHTDLHTL